MTISGGQCASALSFGARTSKRARRPPEPFVAETSKAFNERKRQEEQRQADSSPSPAATASVRLEPLRTERMGPASSELAARTPQQAERGATQAMRQDHDGPDHAGASDSFAAVVSAGPAAAVVRALEDENIANHQPRDERTKAWLDQYKAVRECAPPAVMGHAELRAFPAPAATYAHHRKSIEIRVLSLVAPPLSLPCRPDDSVWSVLAYLSQATQRVLLPSCMELRMGVGLVLHPYSDSSRMLRLSDYGIFSDTDLHLFVNQPVRQHIPTHPENGAVTRAASAAQWRGSEYQKDAPENKDAEARRDFAARWIAKRHFDLIEAVLGEDFVARLRDRPYDAYLDGPYTWGEEGPRQKRRRSMVAGGEAEHGGGAGTGEAARAVDAAGEGPSAMAGAGADGARVAEVAEGLGPADGVELGSNGVGPGEGVREGVEGAAGALAENGAEDAFGSSMQGDANRAHVEYWNYMAVEDMEWYLDSIFVMGAYEPEGRVNKWKVIHKLFHGPGRPGEVTEPKTQHYWRSILAEYKGTRMCGIYTKMPDRMKEKVAELLRVYYDKIGHFRV